MAREIKPVSMPSVPAMPKPPDARIIPLDRQTPLTHAQVEQVRFGLGDTGPLAQAVMNANIPALQKQLTIGAVSCLAARKPADPVVGQMIWETDTQQVRFWNGTTWVTPANATPTGSLQAFAGSAAPTGWLLCDGTAVSRDTYAALFVVTSTTYGAGDGSTTFNVPNLAGRVPVGAGTGAQQGAAGSGVITGGTALTARSVGQFFGDERTELHTHTQNSHNHIQDSHNHSQNSHSHLIDYNIAAAAGGNQSNPAAGGGGAGTVSSRGTTATNIAATATNQAQTATNQNTFAGTGANLQPSVVANYIIKT